MLVYVVFVNNLEEAKVLGVFKSEEEAMNIQIKAFEHYGPFVMIECKEMRVE